jgi:NTP pyrophosphatase (non-canonical NTP hydrolase)
MLLGVKPCPATVPFNGLEPLEAEVLSHLAEEAGEAVQAVTKILRHGIDSYHPATLVANRDGLAKEIGDFQALTQCLVALGLVSMERIEHFEDEKLAVLDNFWHHGAVEVLDDLVVVHRIVVHVRRPVPDQKLMLCGKPESEEWTRYEVAVDYSQPLRGDRFANCRSCMEEFWRSRSPAEG